MVSYLMIFLTSSGRPTFVPIDSITFVALGTHVERASAFGMIVKIPNALARMVTSFLNMPVPNSISFIFKDYLK